jgi:hypothetical protein
MPEFKRFFGRFKIAPLLTGMALFSAVIPFPLSLEAEEKNPAPSTCIAKLNNPALTNIDCTLNFNLDKRTQKSMQENTVGMIRNAACVTKVSMAKSKIFNALLNEEVLRVPRQPVRCNIYSVGDPVLAKFQLAPRIRFAGGKAVQARPGMSGVIGMPEILAKLLTDWVNSSEAIESAMLDEVNKSLKLIQPPSLENINPREKKATH